MTTTSELATAPPRESYGKLFLRFLRFGLLAWGGPVAQIAMIRRELVDDEHWISNERFNRTLAVYQVLPGPEAHELCVYFGMLARGRIGGLLAGLGFMLPGFVLMFALSWFYLTFGRTSPLFQAVFLGFQAAVVALIIRAVHRIGGHALHDRWLFGTAAVLLEALFLVGLAVYALTLVGASGGDIAPQANSNATPGTASVFALLVSGLRAGLLTFGGAYTVIPFLQRDAVALGGWMTNQQFLDGIALSGILPAPLIIFSTFIGYFAGGPLGALAMTFGIFLPAFAITLIGHEYLERLIATPAVHT